MATMILGAFIAWVTPAGIFWLVLDDIGLNRSLRPYCAASIADRTRICPHCQRALGKR